MAPLFLPCFSPASCSRSRSIGLRSELVLTLDALLRFLVPNSTLRREPRVRARSSARGADGLARLLARRLAARVPEESSFNPLDLHVDPFGPKAVGVLLPDPPPRSVIRRRGTDLRLLVLDLCGCAGVGDTDPELVTAASRSASSTIALNRAPALAIPRAGPIPTLPLGSTGE